MTWQTFTHVPTGRTERWLRFHGGCAGDWTRPDGSRVKSICEAEEMGWIPAARPPPLTPEFRSDKTTNKSIGAKNDTDGYSPS